MLHLHIGIREALEHISDTSAATKLCEVGPDCLPNFYVFILNQWYVGLNRNARFSHPRMSCIWLVGPHHLLYIIMTVIGVPKIFNSGKKAMEKYILWSLARSLSKNLILLTKCIMSPSTSIFTLIHWLSRLLNSKMVFLC